MANPMLKNYYTIRLGGQLGERVKEQADKLGLSVTSMVKIILDSWLTTKEKKRK